MDKWVEGRDGHKVLNEMYDFCEKCQWLFYGYKCSVCGTKNTRIGKVNKGGNDAAEEKEETPEAEKA